MSAAPARATAIGSDGLAHALVGGDRDAHVLDAAAQLRQLVDARARLLDVLEVAVRERVHGVLGLVHVPGAVGVDPHAALRTERRPDGSHAGHVVGERLSWFGDLDLHRPASVVARQHLGDGCRRHRRHRRIHEQRVAQRGRLAAPPEVERRGEPRRGFTIVVLGERRELGPALRALEQERFARIDPAEPGDEGESDHARGGEQFVEGREGCRGVVAHGSIMPARPPGATPSRPQPGGRLLLSGVHDRVSVLRRSRSPR